VELLASRAKSPLGTGPFAAVWELRNQEAHGEGVLSTAEEAHIVDWLAPVAEQIARAVFGPSSPRLVRYVTMRGAVYALDLRGPHPEFAFELSPAPPRASLPSVVAVLSDDTELALNPLFFPLDVEDPRASLGEEAISGLVGTVTTEAVLMLNGVRKGHLALLGVTSEIRRDDLVRDLVERLHAKGIELFYRRAPLNKLDLAVSSAAVSLERVSTETGLREVYVPRDVDRELGIYREDGGKAIVVVGDAGTGRTSAVEHFVRQLLSGDGDVVAYLPSRAAFIDGDTRQPRARIASAMLAAVGADEPELDDLDEVVARLNEAVLKTGRRLWVVIDALDEAPDFIALAAGVEALFQNAKRERWLRVVVTIRRNALDLIRRRAGDERRAPLHLGETARHVDTAAFDPALAERAYHLRRLRAGHLPSWADLGAPMQALLTLPVAQALFENAGPGTQRVDNVEGLVDRLTAQRAVPNACLRELAQCLLDAGQPMVPLTTAEAVLGAARVEFLLAVSSIVRVSWPSRLEDDAVLEMVHPVIASTLLKKTVRASRERAGPDKRAFWRDLLARIAVLPPGEHSDLAPRNWYEPLLDAASELAVEVCAARGSEEIAVAMLRVDAIWEVRDARDELLARAIEARSGDDAFLGAAERGLTASLGGRAALRPGITRLFERRPLTDALAWLAVYDAAEERHAGRDLRIERKRGVGQPLLLAAFVLFVILTIQTSVDALLGWTLRFRGSRDWLANVAAAVAAVVVLRPRRRRTFPGLTWWWDQAASRSLGEAVAQGKLEAARERESWSALLQGRDPGNVQHAAVTRTLAQIGRVQRMEKDAQASLRRHTLHLARKLALTVRAKIALNQPITALQAELEALTLASPVLVDEFASKVRILALLGGINAAKASGVDLEHPRVIESVETLFAEAIRAEEDTIRAELSLILAHERSDAEREVEAALCEAALIAALYDEVKNHTLYEQQKEKERAPGPEAGLTGDVPLEELLPLIRLRDGTAALRLLVGHATSSRLPRARKLLAWAACRLASDESFGLPAPTRELAHTRMAELDAELLVDAGRVGPWAHARGQSSLTGSGPLRGTPPRS
jgi:hypothetical protein